MAQLLTGLFPDRETAEHAMRRLEGLGLHPTRMNAEDFDRPDYYTNQMPQGATLISVEVTGSRDVVRRIVQESGGQEVEAVARGRADMPTSMTGDVAGSVPVPEEERRAFAAKGQDSKAEWIEERNAPKRV